MAYGLVYELPGLGFVQVVRQVDLFSSAVGDDCISRQVFNGLEGVVLPPVSSPADSKHSLV